MKTQFNVRLLMNVVEGTAVLGRISIRRFECGRFPYHICCVMVVLLSGLEVNHLSICINYDVLIRVNTKSSYLLVTALLALILQ